MKQIFCKNKIYSEKQINKIAIANGLATVNCLNEENMISLEKWNNGEGEDCLFEFDRIKENSFLLRWSEFEN
ncbi:MAG: hypothetical protein Q8O39_01565 [bacterium]|nr:hypothetical protein [bacterium]